MRKVMMAMAAVGLWLGASTALAASIDPNPATEVRGSGAPGGPLEASVSLISLEGDTATLQLSVVSGVVTGINISMLFDDLLAPSAFNFVGSANLLAGTGDVAGNAGVGAGNSEAQFSFGAGVGAGQTSDQFQVHWLSPAAIGWQGTVEFDNGYASSVQFTVTDSVPEPTALLGLGTALALLGLVRRRAN